MESDSAESLRCLPLLLFAGGCVFRMFSIILRLEFTGIFYASRIANSIFTYKGEQLVPS